MLSTLRALARAPITLVLVAAALVAQTLVVTTRQLGETPSAAISRHTVDFERFDGEPELGGLFSLWNGRPARMAASFVIHRDFATLAACVAMTLLLGLRLEPLWGSLRFALVFLLSSLSGFIVAWLVLETPLGYFSGNCGVLFAAGRLTGPDATGQRLMARWVLPATVASVLLVIFLTVTGQGHGPYLAWLTAMACGWWIGAGPGQPDAPPALPALRWLPWMLAAGLWGAMHPTWFGSYHWYRSKTALSPETRLERLQRAIKVDPQLIGPHIDLCELLASRNERHRAWRTILEALRQHRTEDRLEEAVQRHWKRFDTDGERMVARETLQQVFADESAWWERRLGIGVGGTIEEGAQEPTQISSGSSTSASPETLYPLDQKINLPPSPDDKGERDPRERNPRPNFNDPDNAAEGRRT